MDRRSEIGASLDLLRGLLLERSFQNLPSLVFHRPAIKRGADLELPFCRLFQVSNRNAGHAINDIIAINDCK